MWEDLLQWSQRLGQRPSGPVTVETVVDNTKQLVAAITALAGRSVLVGIPQENNPRSGEPIGNAALGYIFEFGSPAMNMPARPSLIPGITKSKDRWVKKLELAAHDALAGDTSRMRQHFGEAGQIAVNSVTQTIQAGIPPPLAPATVAARRRRTPGSTYRRRATTAADVTPLIDSGDWLRSHTWVWG